MLRYFILGAEILLMIILIRNGAAVPVYLKAAVAAAALVLNLFSQRFFYKYLCPIGSLLGLTNLFKIFAVKKEAECLNCLKCESKCIMNVPLAEKGNNRDTACISCLRCIDACPGNKEYLHF